MFRRITSQELRINNREKEGGTVCINNGCLLMINQD